MDKETQASSPPDGTATTTTEDVSALGAILGQALAPLVTSVTTALEALPNAAALGARVEALEASRASSDDDGEPEDASADAAAVLAGASLQRVASFSLASEIKKTAGAFFAQAGKKETVTAQEPHPGAMLGAALKRPLDASTEETIAASGSLMAAPVTVAPGTVTVQTPTFEVSTAGFVGALPIIPASSDPAAKATFTRYKGFNSTAVTVNSWALGSGGKTATLTVTSHHLTGNPRNYAGTVVLTTPAVNQFAFVIAFTSTTITVRFRTVVSGTPSGGGTITVVEKNAEASNKGQGDDSDEFIPVEEEVTLPIGAARCHTKATLRNLQSGGARTTGSFISTAVRRGLEKTALSGAGNADGLMLGFFNTPGVQYRRGSESTTTAFPLGAKYFTEIAHAYTEMVESGFRPDTVVVPAAIMTELRFALDSQRASSDLLRQLAGLRFFESERLTNESLMFEADPGYIGLQPQSGSVMMIEPIANDKLKASVTAHASVYATLVCPVPLSCMIIDHAN